MDTQTDTMTETSETTEAPTMEAAVDTENTPEATDPTKVRTIEEIQKEYQQLCFMAGELQYQTKIYQENLARLNMRLQAINQEAGKAQEKLNKKAAADAANTKKQNADNIARAEEKRARKQAEFEVKNPGMTMPSAEATGTEITGNAETVNPETMQ